MTHQEILEKLKAKIEVVESKEDLGVLNAVIRAQDIKTASLFMKMDLDFTQLNFMTAVDWMQNSVIELIYSFYSYATDTRAVLRVKLDRAAPEIDSIANIYRTADWHERETYEMFGVEFKGHPDLRRLLLPDGVEMPLRKDFTHPKFEKLPQG